MPYRRNFRKRSRRGRKTAWYNRQYSAKSLALKALKNTNYIRGLVNSEMFHNNTEETARAISSSGYVVSLTSIGQSDTAVGRTGNSILVRNLLSRIRFTMSSSASTTTIRFMLIQDTQQREDTAPTLNEILYTVDVDSPLSIASAGRFKLLMSKTIQLHTYKPTYHSEKYKSLYLHTKYNGTASTDIQKNGIYFVAISDQPTNAPLLDAFFKLGYHDN